jgi:thiamine biosynthesis protein ThiI
MIKPDCILARVGEISLKSRQVQKKFFEILIRNIKASLSNESIKYKMEINPNRIFVYTSEMKKAEQALKKVFGLTSISPCWTCFSGLDEMKLLASDLAVENFKLDSTKSFALRVRTAGRHKFSGRTIAEEVGAAIKRVTNAKVDLSNPDIEIFIECRSRRTYIFTKKIACVGGLPLGVGGRVVSLLFNENDLVASWLLMKRGCELYVLSHSKKLIDIIKKWHVGRKLLFKIVKKESVLSIAKKLVKERKAVAIVSGLKEGEMIYHFPHTLFLYPIFFYTGKEIEKLKKIVLSV